ncbi:MAG TPA: choice-of-anchor D domain-containing protein [Candidatus Limnocylindrales bacterium]|nr:choice-of-anchor D domain-containing protein [Candidatus Limnocylindrales bacterium]
MAKTLLVCLFVGIFLIGSILFPEPAFAGVGATPSAVSFGSVTVSTSSSAATITITNSGRQTVSIQQIASSLREFVVIAPAMPVSIPGRGSMTFQVMFKPDAATTFSGSIVVTPGHKSGGPISIGVSGVGASSNSSQTQSFLLSASMSSLSFGNTLVGSSTSQALTLTNAGTGSVNISQIASSGAGFVVTGFSGGVTLAPGQSLPLTVSFSPAATGAVAGSVSVVSNANNSPMTISLSGTGVQPQISVIPSSVTFGNVTTGVTNSQTLTIRNPGTATLNVSQASIVGSGYTTSGLSLPLSVSPGGSYAFNVGFSPASAGTFSGSLTFISNTPNSPLVISLSGTGVSTTLQLSASPASLAFGSLTTGTSATQSVTVSNTGNAGVSISQITATGAGFSTSGIALPLTLAAGQSASFSVSFAPTSVGNLPGSVTIVSNAANSPLTVSLSGTGASAASHSVSLSWTPGSSTYSGFNVYRGTTSGGPYTRVDAAMISAADYTDGSVSSGQTYYYVATQIDSTGAESGYSSEISAVIP